MGTVVSQGPCSFCTSSDAMTHYSDGGFHCFSCGAHKEADGYTRLIATLKQTADKVIDGQSCPPLPDDVEPLLIQCKASQKAKDWVRKYGITDAEIDQHNFMWSEEKQLLIFPVYDGHELLMWQGRNFSNKPRAPKYITRGHPKERGILHILGADKKGKLVLVEDLLSSIKVSRICPSMPLWGSCLSAQWAKKIAALYAEAFIFLDYDKREYAMKACIDHCMRISLHPIIERQDPKVFSTEELRTIIKEHGGIVEGT